MPNDSERSKNRSHCQGKVKELAHRKAMEGNLPIGFPRKAFENGRKEILYEY